MQKNDFQHRLLSGLMEDSYQFHNGRMDVLRFGNGASDGTQIKQRVSNALGNLARRRGFARRHFVIEEAAEKLIRVVGHLDQLEDSYSLLQDDDSRQLFVDLLKFRILGARHVKLPTNNASYWHNYDSIDEKFPQERHSISAPWGGYVNRYQLPGLAGSIDLHTHPLSVLNTFVHEQYAYRKSGRIIQAEPGDTVIDAGGCWGDTALYFADRTGPQGKVYCFEFLPENLELLRFNIGLNPHLRDTIKVVTKALWDRSGEAIGYCANGPGTVLNEAEQSTLQASTVSIDDLVQEERVERMDLIKMDIEGSELKALQGAEKTIRTFKPKLAISIYHNIEDFFLIPGYINDLGLGYEFFLDHFTTHHEET
ncbi:MAG: FkbM family methyltransferase, partial [Armatimonadota bacterium]|nr:FkbM family methyltransferase [Armatimonadota bacterium]